MIGTLRSEVTAACTVSSLSIIRPIEVGPSGVGKDLAVVGGLDLQCGGVSPSAADPCIRCTAPLVIGAIDGMATIPAGVLKPCEVGMLGSMFDAGQEDASYRFVPLGYRFAGREAWPVVRRREGVSDVTVTA